VPSPRDAELLYKAKIESELRKKELEELVRSLEGKKISPRLRESLGLNSIESLTSDDLDHLRQVLGISQVINDNASLVSDFTDALFEVRADLSKSIVADVIDAIKREGISATGAEKNPDRPQIEKVFVDPSDDIKIDSNIKDLGQATKGESVKEDLALFKKLKKKKRKKGRGK